MSEFPRWFRMVGVMALTAGLLAGCGRVREEVGLTRQSPDEFRVISRAPLTLPPNFGLRPPAPGEARPQEVTPRQQAQTALFGNQAGVAGGTIVSPTEQRLLQRVGADDADPQIRQVIAEENNILYVDDRLYLDRLLGRGGDPAEVGEPLDPYTERQRLTDERATGRQAPDIGQTTPD